MAKTATTHVSRYGSHSVLSRPSMKFFIGQLKRVNQVATDCTRPSLQLRLRSSQQIINVRCVWLQGDLLQWQDDGDTLLLDDGTGMAKVCQVKKILINQKIQVGKYSIAKILVYSSTSLHVAPLTYLTWSLARS